MPSWLASLTENAAWLGVGVVVLAAIALGYQVGQWAAPEPTIQTRTDTVQVERALVKRDTVMKTVPKQVVQFDTVRQVDTVRVAVPTDMQVQGVIPPSPVDVGEQVTLTFFDTDTQRWTQSRFEIPQDDWHLWPSVGAETTPAGLQATATVNLRWEKVTVSAGYMQAADSRGLTFGVRLRPFTISW